MNKSRLSEDLDDEINRKVSFEQQFGLTRGEAVIFHALGIYCGRRNAREILDFIDSCDQKEIEHEYPEAKSLREKLAVILKGKN